MSGGIAESSTDVDMEENGMLPCSTDRRQLPIVCRRFRELANSCPSLWEQVHLSFPKDFVESVDMAALYAWVVAREGAVRSLHVDLSTEAAWPAILGVLGVLGRGLAHLRLAGETPACQRVGCYAPWLQLAPNLTSLELDDVVDAAIVHARFPPGLTRLELSYCGEEGLHSVPANVGQCTRLRSLCLNCATFDSEATLAGLAACTGLQHLDLSNCCLTRVPAVLAQLPQLTSLTLNENDSLGASPAALEPLSALTSLQLLEMRECGLTAVPASLAGLTSLHSLLMGYNSMAERPFLPPGPYLRSLRVLAMSDSKGFQDDTPWDELAGPLAPAVNLEVLRINRCLGLQPSIEDVGVLLAGKPRFRKLEFTADMLADARDLAELRRRWPQVTFKAVE